MNPTARAFTVTFILVLGGCSSFNNSFNTYHFDPPSKTVEAESPAPDLGGDDEPATPPHTAPTPVESTPPRIVVEAPPIDCKVSPYPTPGHPPEIPFKALQAVAGDVYAVEKLERKHIDELRAYIFERRRLQREAVVAFNAKCQAVVK